MGSILRISDAASLGLHACAVLAACEEPISVSRLAKVLGASAAHLSKVLQELTKRGLVTSRRGPQGGYVLARPGNEVRLIDVYEAVEGPLPTATCLLPEPICDGACLLGGLAADVNRLVRDALTRTTLAEFGQVADRLGLVAKLEGVSE